MIKVNLAVGKRRRKLPRLPYEVIIFVIGFACIVAAFFAAQDMFKGKNDDLKEKKRRLSEQNQSQQGKIVDRDKLKQQVSRTKSEIERFTKLSGEGLLQWSQAFANLADVVPSENVWITSLRIDADRRVQISAYACNDKGAKTNEYEAQLTKGIQNFIDALQRHEHFKDVFLQSASKNQYEQASVWRFELNCRITKELTGDN